MSIETFSYFSSVAYVAKEDQKSNKGSFKKDPPTPEKLTLGSFLISAKKYIQESFASESNEKLSTRPNSASKVSTMNIQDDIAPTAKPIAEKSGLLNDLKKAAFTSPAAQAFSTPVLFLTSPIWVPIWLLYSLAS